MTYIPYDPPLGAPLDHIERGIVAVEGEVDGVAGDLNDLRTAVHTLADRIDGFAPTSYTDGRLDELTTRIDATQNAQAILRRDADAWVAQLRTDVAAALEPVREQIALIQAREGTMATSIADLYAKIDEIAGWGSASRGFLLAVPSTASPRMKAGADAILDGIHDAAMINDLIARAAPLHTFSSKGPSSAEQAGRVVVAGGRVYLETTILMRDGVALEGVGNLSEMRAATALGSKPMFGLATPNEHVWSLSKMWINGNDLDAKITGNGIDIDMTGSTNSGVSSYPSMSPDSDFTLQDLMVSNFDNGQRTAVKVGASGVANCRGNFLSRIEIRHAWRGLWLSAASDCHLNMIHIGSCSDAGFQIEGGNDKMVSCKAYYCAVGFRFTGGRGTHGVLEAQDCNLGFDFQAGEITVSSLLADSSETAGIRIGASSLMLQGVNILARTGSGTRFVNQTAGLKIDGAYSDVVITGRIAMTGISTRIAGTMVGRWFMRLVGGFTMDSVG